jgi:predicted phage terminase large subunit-like protein
MLTIDKAKEIKIARVACLTNGLFHSRYFFKKRTGTKFVVNDHHKQIWDALELVLAGKLTKVIINIAPRYGKTEIGVKNFIEHALSLNATAKFIHLSYSDELVRDNSDAIKDTIKSEAYQELFPEVRISNKSDSKKKWYTTAGGGMYAVSSGGAITGFGAGAVDRIEDEKERIELDNFIGEIEKGFEEKQEFAGAIIYDDPIKPDDAESESKREKINLRFDTTVRNRVNSRKTPIIIIGQRTHPRDLSGYVMENDGFTTDVNEAIANPNIWYVLTLPVINIDEEGNRVALWPFKHTLEELEVMEEKIPITFQRQFMQNPQPKEGLMYEPFRTYEHIPATLTSLRKNYTDTADKGKDMLCSINYVETATAIYITDVLYTAKPMITTEPLTGVFLTKGKIQIARVESNNGGEGFARNVEKECRAQKNHFTQFRTFHQSENKEVRIFNNSATCYNLIYMPADWKTRFPEFYKAITTFMKSGKNLFDDAPDALTGCAEWFGKDKLMQDVSGWAGGLA